jgi:hypothetical protein
VVWWWWRLLCVGQVFLRHQRERRNNCARLIVTLEKEHYGTSRVSSSALALSHTRNLYNQNLFKFLVCHAAWHIVSLGAARQLHRYLLNFSSLAHLPGPLVLSGQASELYWVTTHINTHTDTHFGLLLLLLLLRESNRETVCCGYWILQRSSRGISDLIRFYCVALLHF